MNSHLLTSLLPRRRVQRRSSRRKAKYVCFTSLLTLSHYAFQEFIDEHSGPEVSQHMSGSHVLIPSRFSGNPEVTVYYTAVGAGSITALSHASLHSLHVQVLALQDSMCHTTIKEEHLNMDLAAASRPPMHFPSFLPDCLNNLSGPLSLLDHFHGEEATQYRSNPTLSLFTVVYDTARDKKEF